MCEENTPYLQGNRAAPAPVPRPTPSPPPPTNGTKELIRWRNGVRFLRTEFSFCRDESSHTTIRRLRWQQRRLWDKDYLRDRLVLVRLGNHTGYGQVEAFR